MELQFKHIPCNCLHTLLREVRSSEQTQEIRLSDGMPDAGRVVAAWGQAIMRSKAWHSDHIAFSGGMMVWVLYAPEDGSEERCISSWIPFQLQWELPEGTPEGDIRIRILAKPVDARSVSARKIMVRASLSAQAEVCIPESHSVATPECPSEDTPLLIRRYPLYLNKEAGEKVITLDETMTLPESAPKPEKLIACSLEPVIKECRVLTDKLVFRGIGQMHVLYRGDSGQLHSWDFELPFSQYVQLQGRFGTDARADLAMAVTALEPELEENGQFRFKCGLTAQHLIRDREILEIAEDAYSPSRELKIETDTLRLPVILDSQNITMEAEHTLPVEADLASDVQFFPDFPRQHPGQDTVQLDYPGTFQVLYYGDDGVLRSSVGRWEGQSQINAREDTRLQVVPMGTQSSAEARQNIQLKAQMPVQITADTRQEIPMVTAVEPGQMRQSDPNRPSLVLLRPGNQDLWEIAKANGSTVDAIRKANGLTENPEPNQMLLIPVP